MLTFYNTNANMHAHTHIHTKYVLKVDLGKLVNP